MYLKANDDPEPVRSAAEAGEIVVKTKPSATIALTNDRPKRIRIPFVDIQLGQT
jgi:hypothetical protein